MTLIKDEPEFLKDEFIPYSMEFYLNLQDEDDYEDDDDDIDEDEEDEEDEVKEKKKKKKVSGDKAGDAKVNT